MTWLAAQNKQDFFLSLFLFNVCLCAAISLVCALTETQTSMKQQLLMTKLSSLISFFFLCFRYLQFGLGITNSEDQYLPQTPFTGLSFGRYTASTFTQEKRGTVHDSAWIVQQRSENSPPRPNFTSWS